MTEAAARAFYAESNWGNLWGEKGPLYDPIAGHKGHDIRAAGRSLVPALRSGRITSIYRHPVIGWVMAIEHAPGDVDGYCHVILPLVDVGDEVDQFEPIARIATWGDYTGTAWGGPHLHLVNATSTARIHMGPTRDPAPIIASQLFDFAGGGGVPIESEEDDMFSDKDRAHLQELVNRRTMLDLIATPDGTVWWCVNRAIRYAIPSSAQLATYQAHMRGRGLSDQIQRKTLEEARAYGAPVFENQIDRIAAAVDAVVSDEAILAAATAGSAGEADLAPVIEVLKRLPDEFIAKLKSKL